MQKIVGEQDLALQQHFPYKSSKFSENSNCRINLLKLAILAFSMRSFHFWHSLSYSPKYNNFLGNI